MRTILPDPSSADARPSGARDYDTIRRAIAFLSTRAEDQPNLDALADHVGLSPAHVQRVFKRWCGLSPKAFLQAVTLDHARTLLARSASVLETAHAVGLSGSSRLHDLFITHEAVTPGDVRRRGAGLTLAYGWHDTPFGEALAVTSARGLVSLAFVDGPAFVRNGSPDNDADRAAHETARAAAFADIQARWPAADWQEQPTAAAAEVARLFADVAPGPDPVRIVLIGTDFEVRVWQALTRIPMGALVTYADIARQVCTPAAARAVGAAVGRNPLAFVVPCHRVVRADGGLGGYHWSPTRKRALIGWETARIARAATIGTDRGGG